MTKIGTKMGRKAGGTIQILETNPQNHGKHAGGFFLAFLGMQIKNGQNSHPHIRLWKHWSNASGRPIGGPEGPKFGWENPGLGVLLGIILVGHEDFPGVAGGD